jgi:hypothetical protein
MVAQDGEGWVGFAAAVAADDAGGKEAARADFVFGGVRQNIDDVRSLLNVPKMHKSEGSDRTELAVVFVLVEPA